MTTDCVFCAIAAGEAPAVIIGEWGDTITILPSEDAEGRRGCTDGPILVIPRPPCRPTRPRTRRPMERDHQRRAGRHTNRVPPASAPDSPSSPRRPRVTLDRLKGPIMTAPTVETPELEQIIILPCADAD